jgi:hypothetical protein
MCDLQLTQFLFSNNFYNNKTTIFWRGTWWRSWLMHYVTSRKVAVSISDEVTGFFNSPDPTSCTIALESTQSLTEMRTRNLPGGKGCRASKADNLAAICEPIFQKMWDPRCPTTLTGSTACYRDKFKFFTVFCDARSFTSQKIAPF